MPTVTARLIQLSGGVTVDALTDSVTLLVSGLVVSNPGTEPVVIRFAVADRVGETTVNPGLIDVSIHPPGALPKAGENVSIGAVT